MCYIHCQRGLAGENGRESDSGEVKRHKQAAVMASGMAAAMPSSTAAAMATGDGNRQRKRTADGATAATAAMAAKQSDGIKDGVSDSGRRWRQATGGSNGRRWRQ